MLSSVPASFREIIFGIKEPSTVTSSAKDTALLVIDPQGMYGLGGALELTGITEAQRVVVEVVEKYRKAGSPVIWVQHDAGDAPIFNIKDKTGDFIGDVRPQGAEKVIIKHFASSFTGTDLQEHLQSLGVKQVVLTGYQVQLCISNTARSAQELGYDVVLVRDAIATRDIPSADGKSRIPAAQVMEVVCAELADVIATVIWSKNIMA